MNTEILSSAEIAAISNIKDSLEKALWFLKLTTKSIISNSITKKLTFYIVIWDRVSPSLL